MPKIAIFASGAGSNAAQILKHFKGNAKGVSVDCILSNKEQAGVAEVAQDFSVPFFYFSNEAFEQSTAIIHFLEERGVKWIVLAGFLRKISPAIIKAFPGGIINLHPSLLPRYGGKGMYGKYVHQAVLANKERESGITIHKVNEQFDEGEIIFQKSCKIDEQETLESLSLKIQGLEHEYFPGVIENLVLKG
jgi:phosphoribosylglycinamide formyltransferase-1